MLSHLLVATGVLALLTVLPGPDMAVITRAALAGGRQAATRAAAGIVTGLLVWGSLAVLGLTALLTASPRAYLVVKVLAVLYLLYLGVQAFRTQHAPVAGIDVELTPPPSTTARAPFLTGLTTDLLNPKIAVFYTAMLPTLAPPSLPGARGLAVLVVIHVALTFAWQVGYAHLLTRARHVVGRPAVRRALDRVTGVALIGFAVRLVTEHA